MPNIALVNYTWAQHSATRQFPRCTKLYTSVSSCTKINISESTEIISAMVAGKHLVFLT